MFCSHQTRGHLSQPWIEQHAPWWWAQVMFSSQKAVTNQQMKRLFVCVCVCMKERERESKSMGELQSCSSESVWYLVSHQPICLLHSYLNHLTNLRHWQQFRVLEPGSIQIILFVLCNESFWYEQKQLNDLASSVPTAYQMNIHRYWKWTQRPIEAILVTKPFFLKKSCNCLINSRMIGPTFCTCLKTAVIVPVPKSLNDCRSGSHPHSDQVLWETGSSTPCQPGPLPVCCQNQLSRRGCHNHCPSLSLHTSIEQEHQEDVCWLQLSWKCNTLGLWTALKSRSLRVQIGSHVSSMLELNTGKGFTS